MKKILLSLLLSIFVVIGCENTMNTPTAKVEEFLGKYQKLDSAVLDDLDDVIDKDKNMSDEQKKEYRSILEKQYQNLSYKIKNEEVTGDEAEVDVEIEVLDYKNSITKSKKYYLEHPEEFKKSDKKETDNNNNNNTESKDKDREDADANNRDANDKTDGLLEDTKEMVEEKIEDTMEFIDYKLKEMRSVSTKTKYDITFHLTKNDGVWTIEDLTDEDRQKIHGLY